MKRCCFFFMAFLASLVLAAVSDTDSRQEVTGRPVATAHQTNPKMKPGVTPGKGMQFHSKKPKP